jgi:hypothetical protein
MKYLVPITAAVFFAISPAIAQEENKGDTGQGLSLMEEGMKLLFKGMVEEMDPMKEELRNMFESMGPAFLELQGVIGDLTNYHKPEVLPNGDIIIRRKIPLVVEPPVPEETDI